MKQQKPDHSSHLEPHGVARSQTPSVSMLKAPRTLVERPALDNRQGWKAYWEACQQPWRVEPEIEGTRQQELTKWYAVTPEIEQGIYPFRGIKLSRADMEWLLATYQDSFTPEQGLDVRGADLDGVDLSRLPLTGLRGGLTSSEWNRVPEEHRAAAVVHMNHTVLSRAQLQNAQLSRTQLQGAKLSRAQLQDADLYGAQLQNANLNEVVLANLRGVGPGLADVRWDGVNLAVIDWSQIKVLGNEQKAQQKTSKQGDVKKMEWRLIEYREAVRANRQLAVALQAQGLNEEAAHFAYRANVLQRKVLWFQMVQSPTPLRPRIFLRHRVRTLGAWAFSHLLNTLAGYGYRPGRSFLAYLLIVLGFMGTYLLTSQFAVPHLSWDEALVLSLSSFHGRGFFTQTLTLGDPYARLAVAEAILGLFVEVSLIATFTQRFFGK